MAQKTIVGLDIGTTKLRAVEALQGSQPKIIGIASVSLPPHAIIEGEVRDPQAFATALKELWKIGKFTARDVRVVFNHEKNITRLMPFDDEVDFGKTLPFRLKNQDISPSEYYISYHTLRKYEVQEEDRSVVEGYKMVPKRDIFLAAVKRTYIESILEGFGKTDLRVLSIDLAPLALVRGDTLLSSYPEHDEVNIHVNIGGATSTIVITNHSQPVFVRVVNIGGNLITEYIAETLDVSEEEAERLKIRTLTMNPKLFRRETNAGTVFGSPDDAPETDDSESYSLNEIEAYDIVNDELSTLIQAVSEGIIYFISRNTFGLGENIENMYISGATTAFGKIKHHLSLEIGARNTQMSRPLSFMQKQGLISEGLVEQFYSNQFEYTTAVGAILGNGGEEND